MLERPVCLPNPQGPGPLCSCNTHEVIVSVTKICTFKTRLRHNFQLVVRLISAFWVSNKLDEQPDHLCISSHLHGSTTAATPRVARVPFDKRGDRPIWDQGLPGRHHHRGIHDQHPSPQPLLRRCHQLCVAINCAKISQNINVYIIQWQATGIKW